MRTLLYALGPMLFDSLGIITFAILLLDDRLNPLLDASAPRADALALLDDMLTID